MTCQWHVRAATRPARRRANPCWTRVTANSRSPSSLELDFPVLLFKVGYPFLYHLLKLAVLCSALVFCDISELIQKLLLNAQRISAQIVLHFAASVTKY